MPGTPEVEGCGARAVCCRELGPLWVLVWGLDSAACCSGPLAASGLVCGLAQVAGARGSQPCLGLSRSPV